ncbi:MAG TPA: hypothetical protein VJ716_06710 [Gaiellaceae bacterium]|nr:hypothetical protein [Gaiellaceae bacterium]
MPRSICATTAARLAVGTASGRKRLDPGIGRDGLQGIETRVERMHVADLRGEFRHSPVVAAVGRPSLVREDATRDAIQPRKRIVRRNGVESAPSDKEGLGEGVGRILGTGRSAQRVREDRAPMKL